MTCINGEVLNHNLVSSCLNLIMLKILTRKFYIGPSMTYLVWRFAVSDESRCLSVFLIFWLY